MGEGKTLFQVLRAATVVNLTLRAGYLAKEPTLRAHRELEKEGLRLFLPILAAKWTLGTVVMASLPPRANPGLSVPPNTLPPATLNQPLSPLPHAPFGQVSRSNGCPLGGFGPVSG